MVSLKDWSGSWKTRLVGSKRADGGRGSRSKRSKKQSWDPARTLAGVRWIAGAGLVVGLCLTWRWGEQVLRVYAVDAADRAATQRRGVHPDADGARTPVDLVAAPDWLTVETRQRTEALVADRAGDGLFDAVALREAARLLESQPWVASVAQIRRVPAGVRVEAVFREPVALLETAEGYHVLDADGVWLEGPRAWSSLARNDLPVLTRVTSPRPAALGDRWRGADVQAGLELAALVADRPWAAQVVSYDVGQRDARTGRPRLVMHTDAGSVVWGTPVGAGWTPAEVPSEQKLERLDRLAQHYLGRIDGGGRTVLLYGEELQFDHRPTIAADGPPSRGEAGDRRRPTRTYTAGR